MTEEIKITDRRVDHGKEGAEQGASAVEQAQADHSAGAGAFQGCVMPQVCFPTFVLSLSSSALVHLGEVPDPETGKTSENIEIAKHTIDILAMLEEKTKGNLDAEESKLLKDMLFELRMHYVRKSS
ncbi:DUF1844 domain-containing protein [Desulfonatronum sp. SC1]|uniref:DUF1844 domain-containing protein n=1 Tax=Desulfonatronum sp. SC1 TaxID=2109626 RepID=UPI000D311070|nr:DUF1844 domain-containing protein [Desulfonatronum sp. SC1]PTN32738.1 DUF1844 domain-containing protein [Desulfonatronum sp. SC1]